MNEKTKEYRIQLAQIFIESLEEKQLDWRKGWGKNVSPENAITGGRYKGINRFFLFMRAMAKGYTDPRWATFNQIKEKGWKLRTGSKGGKVEYWIPFDQKELKFISWEELKRQKRDPNFKDENIKIKSKYYTVFNGNCIEGIPPLPEMMNNEISPHILIEKMSESMNVAILNDSLEGKAYYSIREDQIHLPPIAEFHSDYDYNATVLHELSHSTGAIRRLNRIQVGGFGSEPYAYEELVAEISSCFMCSELNLEWCENHINNHKAYVQSWISGLRDKPELIVRAVRDAEKAADYLGYHAGMIPEQEYQKLKKNSQVMNEEKILPDIILKEKDADNRNPNFLNISELRPELKKKLQSLEKEGVVFSTTSKGQIKIPCKARDVLSKDEIADTRAYIKNTIHNKELIKTSEEICMKHTFSELIQ